MKNILITGVSTGIGFDAVRHFVTQGYRVFGSVRSDKDVVLLTQKFPENFICLQFDVVDIEQVEAARQLVEQVLAGERLTALVNNAGFAQGGPMALFSDQAFRQQIEVNLFGVRNVINAFLPFLGATQTETGDELIAKPGKVINISSLSGIFNTPMNGAYCVAKHALESLTEVYRRELMIYGIQLATIQPGPIQPDLWDKNHDSMDVYLKTDYVNMAKNTRKIIHKSQLDALPASVVSELIETIIQTKKPKLSYIVHRHFWQTYLLTKLTPKRLVDWLFFRTLNKKTE